MSVNIDKRSILKKNSQSNTRSAINTDVIFLPSDDYFKRTGGWGEGVLVSRFSDRVLRTRDHMSQKIVLKIKSIVMRTTNKLLKKVHNYTHFKG